MPNLGLSAEFRRQDHFRLQSLAGSNIGAEFERQPIFGFSQHRPNLGAEFRLQNLSFRGVRNRDLPRVFACYANTCVHMTRGLHPDAARLRVCPDGHTCTQADTRKINKYKCLHTCTDVRTYVCVFVCMHAYLHVCVHASSGFVIGRHVSICMGVCVLVCVCIPR